MPEPTYRVPATVAEMLPPKAATLIAEAANFIRGYWEEIKPYYQSISGEIESKHGSLSLDEAACVFEVQRLASENGFALLGSVKTVELRRALRFGFKRNTGTPMRVLENQYRQLRLAQRG